MIFFCTPCEMFMLVYINVYICCYLLCLYWVDIYIQYVASLIFDLFYDMPRSPNGHWTLNSLALCSFTLKTYTLTLFMSSRGVQFFRDYVCKFYVSHLEFCPKWHISGSDMLWHLLWNRSVLSEDSFGPFLCFCLQCIEFFFFNWLKDLEQSWRLLLAERLAERLWVEKSNQRQSEAFSVCEDCVFSFPQKLFMLLF